MIVDTAVEPLAPATMTSTHLRAQLPWYFYTRPSPSSIVRAWQAQLGPLDGRGFETPWVQKYAPPHSKDGSAPSLRVAASESASEQACRRLGVTQAASPRAARRTSVAMPLPLYYLTNPGGN